MRVLATVTALAFYGLLWLHTLVAGSMMLLFPAHLFTLAEIFRRGTQLEDEQSLVV